MSGFLLVLMSASYSSPSARSFAANAHPRALDQEELTPAGSQSSPELAAIPAADGLVLVGADGVIQVLTEAFCQLWALPGTAAEWLGRPFAQLDALLQARVADVVAYQAKSEQLRAACAPHYHCPLPLADGRVLEVDFLPVGAGLGGQQLWSVRDATQRERVAAQLRELAAIPDQNPNPLLRLDAAGNASFTNAAARDLYAALSAAEATELCERLKALVAEGLRTDAPQQAELSSGGRHFQVTVKPLAAQQYANVYFIDITDRYHATRQLDEQRAFYESILNELPTEIAVFDPDQRYCYLNARCMLEPEERQQWLGKSILETAGLAGRTQQLVESRHALLEQAVREHRLLYWEDNFTAADGSTSHYLYFYQPVFGPDGNLKYIVAHNADITARVRAELELREQQTFMQLVLDTVPSAIFVFGPQLEITFENYHARQLHPALISRTDAYFDAARASYMEAFAKVLATGEEVVTENQITMTTGEVRWYQNVRRPLQRASGEVHVLGISTDITALKQAQHTLERSEKQYRDLMHYSQALICTYDLQGTLLTVNPALAALLGRPVAELIGQCVATVLLADNQALFADYMIRVVNEGEAKGVTRVVPAGGGRPYYILYYAYLLREPGQQPYVISHAHDITERVLAEQDTQRARKEAEAAARARSNFLANMSHEIRTPMNGVLGIAAQLAKTRLDPRQQELLHIIRTSGQHLLAVLNDVLDMAKITAGKLELEQAVFHLPNAVSEALQPLAVQAQEKGLAFRVTQVPDAWLVPWVVGDPHRLQQILLNLVSNALKFTERGGIVVSIERLAETDTAVTVCVRVTDTGCGIAPDKQALIFESFTQAYADTARHYGGTGLGLSISQALVEQMGGTLTLTSAVEEGSTFAFTLVLQKAPRKAWPVAATPFVPLSPGRLAGARVLLVEDNYINRTLAQMLLEPWGVLLTEAGDGPEALALLTEQPPFDVVLLDIQLPTLSGLDVIQQLRQLPNPRRAATPVIALTANVFQVDVERYLAAGFDDYLAKPYEEAELYQKIERLLPVPPATPG
jgi:PAS domain S-box-containing protein